MGAVCTGHNGRPFRMDVRTHTHTHTHTHTQPTGPQQPEFTARVGDGRSHDRYIVSFPIPPTPHTHTHTHTHTQVAFSPAILFL